MTVIADDASCMLLAWSPHFSAGPLKIKAGLHQVLPDHYPPGPSHLANYHPKTILRVYNHAVLKHHHGSRRTLHGRHSYCTELRPSQLVGSFTRLRSYQQWQQETDRRRSYYDKECQNYAGHRYPSSGTVTGGPAGSQAIIWVNAGGPYCCDGKPAIFLIPYSYMPSSC